MITLLVFCVHWYNFITPPPPQPGFNPLSFLLVCYKKNIFNRAVKNKLYRIPYTKQEYHVCLYHPPPHNPPNRVYE